MAYIFPIANNISDFGYRQTVTNPTYTKISMPDKTRNYVVVDKNKTDFFVKQGEKALPQLQTILGNSKDETEITETLYIIDRMIDSGVKGIDKMYPVFAKFNDTTSPNIQTFLAGIYRKTQVPDAFGPLISMLIRNSVTPNTTSKAFDPNEEIGGAILSYLA